MDTVEKALRECRDALEGSLRHKRLDPSGIQRFQENFRKDFEEQLGDKKGSEKWERDRVRVTTLARAIGTLAEFIAIASPAPGLPDVTHDHLEVAYRTVKPHCAPAEPHTQREYCTSYALSLEAQEV